MIKLSSEIINGAMTKSGCYNSDFLTQLTLTNALNDSYRSLYTQIAQSDSDYYWKDYTFTEEDVEEDINGEPTEWVNLPKDCFVIKSVTFNNVELQRCPPNEKINGQYQIKNSMLRYNGNTAVGITIHYVPVPQIITVPAGSELINVDPERVHEYGRCTEDGFYYKTIDGTYFYSFKDQTSTPQAFVAANDDYDGYKLKYGPDYIHLVDPENDKVEYDLTEDYEVGESNPIKKVAIDEPYMMVSYEDGTIIIAQNFEQTVWNINARTGHKTKGIIHTMATNDSTLYGCVYEDDKGKLWLASFVPDTILNYPTNALFKVLEIELACLLISMNGLQNEYITTTLKEEAIEEFRNELRQCRAMPMRIQNQYRQRGFVC